MINEVDIEFNTNHYAVPSNGRTGPDFSLLLLQPNHPPGFAGDYSAEATIDHPSFAGTFRVDFTWIGPGSPLDPGADLTQTFHVETYTNIQGDPSFGNLISSTTGAPPPFAASAAPQPSTVFPRASGLMVSGATLAVNRRRSDTAC